MSTSSSSARALAKTIAIQGLIFLAGLVAVEFALRQFFPLPPHGGEYRDLAGNPVRVSRDADTLQPRLDVRHIAAEFNARIRTGNLGYRRMSNESRTPDYLFLGDSFTFGHGVSDDEVFAEIMCRKRNAACLNLGRSGTNTFDQVRTLRRGIEMHQLRPTTVVLTMLTACWLGVAGNDLGDNLAFQRNAKRTAAGRVPVVRASLGPSLADAMRTLQGWLGRFEITKRVMIVASSSLKRGVYSCSQASEVDEASNATAIALDELAQLAGQHGFQVNVVTIHPYQDLGGGFRVAEAAVSRALPKGAGCVATGSKFGREHYYQYDGHFNASGHANLAAILDAKIDNVANACASGQ